MAGTFESYWGARSKRLRAKMCRLSERLVASGGFLEEIRDVAEMGRAVAEHGRLEVAGWKGKERTAIDANNAQGLFYREVLERFAAAQGARVYQLRLGGRAIASQISIHQNGILVLLKTAHDESCAEWSPERLLDYLMLHRLFSEQEFSVVEFYTNASAEDQRWGG